MKTFIFALIGVLGLALTAPVAEARDKDRDYRHYDKKHHHRHYDRDYRYYRRLLDA